MKMTRSCTNCIHVNVCRYCISHTKMEQGCGVEVTRTVFNASYGCEHYRPDTSIVFEKVVNQATDEIFGSVSEAASGNYWLNEYWNLFCEKEQLCGSTYFVVKLERYGDSEECQDFEFDTEETNIDTEVELRLAVENILRRNMFLLEEML